MYVLYNSPPPPSLSLSLSLSFIVLLLFSQDREDFTHSSRERCASRASQHVYGISDEEDESRDRLPSPLPPNRDRPSTPRSTSPRRLRRTISGALDITEDVGLVAVGANPNLSKIWHHAYRKEVAHQHHLQPSPRGSPLLEPRSRASSRSRASPHLGTVCGNFYLFSFYLISRFKCVA